jgi:hypothetical protein
MKNNGLQPLSDQLALANQFSQDLRPQIIACEKFQKGLNSTPLQVIKHKHTGVMYIPVSAIEASLDRMFTGLWSTKNADWRLIANEVVFSLELHYFHPIAKVWLSRCGVGAAQMRMVKGSQITDINGKIKNALEMDVAHAKADALKNAAKSIGDLFGRNVARKKEHRTPYEGILSKLQPLANIQEAVDWINEGNTIEDLKKIKLVSEEQKTEIMNLLNPAK